MSRFQSLRYQQDWQLHHSEGSQISVLTRYENAILAGRRAKLSSKPGDLADELQNDTLDNKALLQRSAA